VRSTLNRRWSAFDVTRVRFARRLIKQGFFAL
jgi:hypothetical protein